MFLLFLKVIASLKKISLRRTGLIALAAGGIFLLLSSIYWQKNVGDNLTGRIPSGVEVYFRLSYPRTAIMPQLKALNRQIFNDLGIGEIPDWQLARELGVFSFDAAKADKYYLILTTDSKSALEDFIKSKNWSYYFLNRRTVLVCFSPDCLNLYNQALAKGRLIKTAKVGKPLSLSTMNLYLNSSATQYFSLENGGWPQLLWQLYGNDQGFWLNAKAQKTGLKIILSNAKSERKVRLPQSADNYDLIYSLDHSKQAGFLGDYFSLTAKQSGLEVDSQLAKKLMSGQALFLISKKAFISSSTLASSTSSTAVSLATSTRFFVENDFCLKFKPGEVVLNGEIKELEESLKSLIALGRVGRKRVWLSDNSSVIELVPDKEGIAFNLENGYFMSDFKDQAFKLGYKTEKGEVYVTNNSEFCNNSLNYIKYDYWQLKKALWPNSPIFTKYLSQFNVLSVNGEFIYLK